MTDKLDRNEPLDPDSGPRRLLLRPLVLVALGGAAGTTARYLLGETISDVAGMPFGIFAINLTGAFPLGWLVEALARFGPDTGRRRDLRLLLGTGVIGGFTTYSALAADTAVLLRDGTPWLAAAYSLGTVLLGAVATIVGIAVGRHLPYKRGANA